MEVRKSEKVRMEVRIIFQKFCFSKFWKNHAVCSLQIFFPRLYIFKKKNFIFFQKSKKNLQNCKKQQSAKKVFLKNENKNIKKSAKLQNCNYFSSLSSKISSLILTNQTLLRFPVSLNVNPFLIMSFFQKLLLTPGISQ